MNTNYLSPYFWWFKRQDEIIRLKTRKTKIYKGMKIDFNLSEDKLNKINSFKNIINISSICGGHEWFYKRPSITFEYKGNKSIIDVYIQLSNIKNSRIYFEEITNQIHINSANIFNIILYNYSIDNWLDEIYENFKIIANEENKYA